MLIIFSTINDAILMHLVRTDFMLNILTSKQIKGNWGGEKQIEREIFQRLKYMSTSDFLVFSAPCTFWDRQNALDLLGLASTSPDPNIRLAQ